MQIHYCGVCGSDPHAVRHAGPRDTPLVAGHEMTGTVTAIGPAVTEPAVTEPGDPVALGNVVDS